MAHGKDILVSEWTSEYKGVPFSSSKWWHLTRLETQYRIPNRRLTSVTNSFIGDNQRLVSEYDRRQLNLSDNENAIIVPAGGAYGRLIILTEVNHVTSDHPNYFRKD